jgi:hypothetical protein
MRISRKIRQRIRSDGDGVHLAADISAVVAANVGEHGAVTVARSTDTGKENTVSEHEPEVAMTEEELEDQAGEELPDREAMSLINANLAAPVNAAVALNALSDNSVAYANAEQTGNITQGIG